MLQQTQTARVLGHFDPFVARFGDVRALAAADRGEVLALWSGLGYNRRAVALHRSAALIADRFGGSVPSGEQDLRALPGVGPSTAGAVQAFGFGLPAVFVETNIRRAALHELVPGRESVSDRELLPVLEQALDRADPRTWYWALMDYGAALARSGSTPLPKPAQSQPAQSQPAERPLHAAEPLRRLEPPAARTHPPRAGRAGPAGTRGAERSDRRDRRSGAGARPPQSGDDDRGGLARHGRGHRRARERPGGRRNVPGSHALA